MVGYKFIGRGILVWDVLLVMGDTVLSLLMELLEVLRDARIQLHSKAIEEKENS